MLLHSLWNRFFYNLRIYKLLWEKKTLLKIFYMQFVKNKRKKNKSNAVIHKCFHISSCICIIKGFSKCIFMRKYAKDFVSSFDFLVVALDYLEIKSFYLFFWFRESKRSDYFVWIHAFNNSFESVEYIQKYFKWSLLQKIILKKYQWGGFFSVSTCLYVFIWARGF